MTEKWVCVECRSKGHKNILAEFMYLDEVVNELKPLCGKHMDEQSREFGELNIEFCHIDNHFEILRMVNAKLQFLSKKYSDLLEKT